MLDPALYPGAERTVELRETHASWVFLAGKRAYKVKKPVVFPFLDYGTAERRREMCELEVELNRRLAPQIYLRVIGIAKRGGSYALSAPDDPQAVEHAVEMLRVDESHSLDALARRGELRPAMVASVGAALARFHRQAPVAPPRMRAPEVLVATLEENLATLREAGARFLEEGRIDAAKSFTHAFLAARGPTIAERGRRGLIRDGHGDLRAEHVIVPPGEPLYVYDCVEFDPALRQIDVGADLAFLVMDLARLGAEEPAHALADAYRREGGDPGDEALLSFFAAYRAWVRAKIACLRLAENGDEAGGRANAELEAEARDLTALGHRFAWRARRPLALAVCGVTGTGKSTLAAELARASGWPHVSSDVVRKRLAGMEPGERAEGAHYSAEFTARTYEELGRLAREALDGAGGVIVDATFHRRALREQFRAAFGAARLGFVECEAPPETLRERVRARELDPQRVSDATEEVLELQLAAREPIESIEGPSARLETDAKPAALLTRVEAFADSLLGA